MSQPTSYKTQTLDNAGLGGHQVHRDDEPLPGARGGAPSVPYTDETPGSGRDYPEPSSFSQGHTQSLTPASNYDLATPIHQGTHIRDNNNKQRTMENETIGAGHQTPNDIPGTQEPTSTPPHRQSNEGSHHQSAAGAFGNSQQTTSAKPKLADRVLGKTQELTGKAFKNQPLQEKGELRQQGDHF